MKTGCINMIRKIGLTLTMFTFGLASALTDGGSTYENNSLNQIEVIVSETINTAGFQPNLWSVKSQLAIIQPRPWSVEPQLAIIQPRPWSIEPELAVIQPRPWSRA